VKVLQAHSILLVCDAIPEHSIRYNVPMAVDEPQIDFWSHFQTERPEVFAASRGRLEYLVGLAKRNSRGKILLNIGCGDGYLERFALQKNWKVVSVDPDSKSIDQLKSAGVDARCGTIESLPVTSGSIDIVISTEVFEHLTPDSLYLGLKEIQRVLRPGGSLIGTVPYRENLSENEVFCPHCKATFHRWGHHQSFDEFTMRSLLGNYFLVKWVRPIFFGAWNTQDWKGKLSTSAKRVFSAFGIHGSSSNLAFVASNAKPS
jgi:SAM-dependent methyltransferase